MFNTIECMYVECNECIVNIDLILTWQFNSPLWRIFHISFLFT